MAILPTLHLLKHSVTFSRPITPTSTSQAICPKGLWTSRQVSSKDRAHLCTAATRSCAVRAASAAALTDGGAQLLPCRRCEAAAASVQAFCTSCQLCWAARAQRQATIQAAPMLRQPSCGVIREPDYCHHVCETRIPPVTIAASGAVIERKSQLAAGHWTCARSPAGSRGRCWYVSDLHAAPECR